MPNPNPLQPNPALLGLQKAQSIGADPAAMAFRDMHDHMQTAAIPDPKNRVMGGVNALDTLIDMGRKYYGPIQETLGESNPDFTPVGGEGMFNIARGATRKAGDALESAYHNLMPRLGGVSK